MTKSRNHQPAELSNLGISELTTLENLAFLALETESGTQEREHSSWLGYRCSFNPQIIPLGDDEMVAHQPGLVRGYLKRTML